PALVVVYATLGIPIARLADRKSRVNIMSLAIAAWSLVVTLSAAVTSFWQFALARIGVGVGEAGFSAIGQSLLVDYHSEKDRNRAISIFMLAIPLGGVLSNLFAGWINELYGWRAVFVAAGLPGIALAMLLKLTVREPARVMGDRAARLTGELSLWRVVASVWRRPSLRWLALGMVLLNTVAAAMVTWMPTFFTRMHGAPTGELGTWMAVINGVGGSAGIWLGGYVADRVGAGDKTAPARVIGMVSLLIAPALLLALWTSSSTLAFLLLLPAYGLMFFFFGPTFVMVQGLCRPEMRATVLAVFLLLQTLAGGFLGIQFLGVMSDALSLMTGSSAIGLKWSMSGMTLLALPGAAIFWRAAGAIRVETAQAGGTP
ncbi:MAG: spinster family MFS transporter, partial [Phenylobacterium sp.]